MSFMVHDEQGRVWPPCFESELMKPGGRFTMVPRSASLSAIAQKGAEARAAGKGWGNGTLAHLVKPEFDQKASNAVRYKFHRVGGRMSPSETVWLWLGENPGKAVTEDHACEMLGLRIGKVREKLKSAINANVLNFVSRGAVVGYVRGALMPAGANGAGVAQTKRVRVG